MLCVSCVFNVSGPTGSISAMVPLRYLVKIIIGMYKDSILISNINLNTCEEIYMYKLGEVKTLILSVVILLTAIWLLLYFFNLNLMT